MKIDGNPKDIAERFVQTARFVAVDQTSRSTGNAVGKLVAHNIEWGKRRHKVTVAIAVGHGITVPESIVIPLIEVHKRKHGVSVVIITIPAMAAQVIIVSYFSSPMGISSNIVAKCCAVAPEIIAVGKIYGTGITGLALVIAGMN